MQFFTVAGAIVVALCGLEGARRLNKSVDADLSGVSAYLSLLYYTRTQIDLYALPVSEIFERCSHELLFSCGWCEESVPSSFDELFDCCKINDKEAKKVIMDFCRGFGRNYREEELRRCDSSIALLTQCHERLFSEMTNKKKLNFTLCLSGSLALIILLI